MSDKPSLFESARRWKWDPPRESKGDVPPTYVTWGGERVGWLQWSILCGLQVSECDMTTAELSEALFVQWEDHWAEGKSPGFIGWGFGDVYAACRRLAKRGLIEGHRPEPGDNLKWKLLRPDPEIEGAIS